MRQPFQDFDFNSFWEADDYATQSYVGSVLTQKMVEDYEDEIGYKLPKSYIRPLKSQNGGLTKYGRSF